MSENERYSLCSGLTNLVRDMHLVLIAFRIWRNEREVADQSPNSSRASGRLGRDSLLPIARIILESGALYTVFLIAFTIVLRLETPRRQKSMPILANMVRESSLKPPEGIRS